MRITTLALAIMGAFGVTALAQNPSAPGTQDNSKHCMEGMAMPGCPQTDKTQKNIPSVLRDMGNRQMVNSQQPRTPDTHPTMTLQDPENPAHLPGPTLPSPQFPT